MSAPPTPRPAPRPARRGRRATPRSASVLLALAALLGVEGRPAGAAPSAGLSPATRKAIEGLATTWAKARPKTKFQSWDPQARADIAKAAKDLGAIPEGSLE